MKFYLKLFLFLLTTVPAFSITYEVGFNEESKDPVFIQLESETSYLCYIENNKFIVERKGIDQDKFTFLDHEFFYSSEVLALKQIKLNNVDHILVTSSNELGFYISILEVTDNEIQRIDWLNNDIVSNSEIKDIDITEIGYEHLLITYTTQDQITFFHKKRNEINIYNYDYSVKDFDIAMGYINDELVVNGAFRDSVNNLYKFELMGDIISFNVFDQINSDEIFLLKCGYSLNELFFKIELENKNRILEYKVLDSLNVEKIDIDLSVLGEKYYFKDYETFEVAYYNDNEITNKYNVTPSLNVQSKLFFRSLSNELLSFDIISRIENKVQSKNLFLEEYEDYVIAIGIENNVYEIKIFNKFQLDGFDNYKLFKFKHDWLLSEDISTVRYNGFLLQINMDKRSAFIGDIVTLTSNKLEFGNE